MPAFLKFIAIIVTLATPVSHQQDVRKHGKPPAQLSQQVPGRANPNYPQRSVHVGRFK